MQECARACSKIKTTYHYFYQKGLRNKPLFWPVSLCRQLTIRIPMAVARRSKSAWLSNVYHTARVVSKLSKSLLCLLLKEVYEMQKSHSLNIHTNLVSYVRWSNLTQNCLRTISCTLGPCVACNQPTCQQDEAVLGALRLNSNCNMEIDTRSPQLQRQDRATK